MGGGNEPENLISLSYQDHYDSHLILANCFDKKCIEYYKNCYSALRLTRWVEMGDDLRKLLSENQKGEKNHNFGKKHSIEHKNNISNKLKGAGNPMFGKKHTPEAVEKITRASTGRIHSEETKKKMSNSQQQFLETEIGKEEKKKRILRIAGRANKSQNLSEETKKKISQSHIGIKMPPKTSDSIKKQVSTRKNNNKPWHSDETKKKIGESNKGRQSPAAHPCIIDGIYYRSVGYASEQLHLWGGTVKKRITSTEDRWKNWNYSEVASD
jgi:hypothetical protein